jgi:hypothetical protein
MATHELLAKNFFEVHLKIKAILLSWIHQISGQIVVNDLKFICYVTYSLSMRCPIWTSMFLNKTLVFANYYNMLFSAMVEKCSRTLIFWTTFKIYLKIWISHNLINCICNGIHMFHHVSISMPPTIQCIIKKTFMTVIYLKSHLQFCHFSTTCKLHWTFICKQLESLKN